MSVRRLSVLVLEDHADERQLICRKLARQPDFAVVGEFADAESALAWLVGLPDSQVPDVFVVDWHLGEGRMDGFEFIRRIKLLFPRACCVLITAYDLEHLPAEAARSGADGFIFKSDPLKLLPVRLRAALAGQFPLSEKAAQYLFASLRQESAAAGAALEKLTACERATLLGVIAGQPEKQVAAERKRSLHTIRNQLASAFQKLGVHSVPEAAQLLRGGGRTGSRWLK